MRSRVMVGKKRLFELVIDKKFIGIVANGRDFYIEAPGRFKRVRLGLDILLSGARVLATSVMP